MTAVVVRHGHCFDGMATAALLTRYLRERSGPGLEIVQRGLEHQAGGSHVPDSVLSGDENAVVDFRYTTSDRLHWYFDHHATGVLADEREHLAADTSGRKHWDPTIGSCALLLRDFLRVRHGFEAPELEELVHRAHIIDTAGYADARSAVTMDDPAARLSCVLELYGDDAFVTKRIELLSRGVPLAEVADAHDVRKASRKVQRAHDEGRRLVEAQAREEGGVVSLDLAQSGGQRFNRFLPYLLFPASSYFVALTESPARLKISVGSNPWAPTPRRHDVGALCARYGGGGHPVVGAVSLPRGELERARALAAAMAEALRA